MYDLFFCWNSPTVDVLAEPMTDDMLSECFGVIHTASAILQRSVMLAFSELARRTTLPPVTPAKPASAPAPKSHAKRSRSVK